MRILWCGCNPGKIGGQCRVALFVLRELVKLGYEVASAGKGTLLLDQGETLPCTCYPWSEFDDIAELHKIIDTVKPDVILCSHDIWNYYYIAELKQKYPQIKIVGWWTIDAHPIHSSWFSILRTTDYNCVSTDFGKHVIYQRWPERMIETIQYGVDHAIYNLQ